MKCERCNNRATGMFNVYVENRGKLVELYKEPVGHCDWCRAELRLAGSYIVEAEVDYE